MKKALICGVSGQDGSYLAAFLLGKGYQVCGASRDDQVSDFRNLVRLGIREQVETTSMSLTDFRSTLQVINTFQPDEIYNLSGQSSVGLSFQQPVETLESITLGALNLLEAVRFLDRATRIYNAGSGECFGDTGDNAANEETPFRPRSPYAVAKAAAHWEVANYREAYGLHACTGILFNHESPLRPERFVTRKIVSAACRISSGSGERLTLGNLDISRDWGWAPEYVEAMWLMLQRDTPQDFVIATGETNSLRQYCAAVFRELDLHWEDHVDIDRGLFRPSEILMSRADVRLAEKELGWKSETNMAGAIGRMIESEGGEILPVAGSKLYLAR